MEYGPEIKIVDGKRPEGLQDSDRAMFRVNKAWFGPHGYLPVGQWEWKGIVAIRLPADHPIYKKQDEIADWADKRVTEMQIAHMHYELPLRTAFARYIMQHEKPPVDPLMLEAIQMVEAKIDLSEFKRKADHKLENHWAVVTVYNALKRGMELANETRSSS